MNSNNEVALDIGSIAAAGEKCIDKVVMVSGKTLIFETVEKVLKMLSNLTDDLIESACNY